MSATFSHRVPSSTSTSDAFGSRTPPGVKALPGGTSPDLVLFDLRRGEAISVVPNDAEVEERVAAAVRKIVARDFALGPQHAERPCVLCAYRPICKDRR